MTSPPPLPPPPAPSPAAGPTQDERTMALLVQLGLIFAPLLSLIIWLIKRENSAFVEHHGRQALSFFIGSLIAGVFVVALCFVCVGFFLLPVYLVLHIVLPILAALAANRGEWYRYPVVGGLFA